MGNYKDITNYYKECLEKHGDNHLGLGWPNYEDTFVRHEIMLGLIKNNYECSILDFGCGLGDFYRYIKSQGVGGKWFDYTGLDINPKHIEHCKQKHSRGYYDDFICQDIFEQDLKNNYDYIVCNGVFTIKRNLSQEEMMFYMLDTLDKLWKKCNKGLAFNTMSTNVDWKRDDLFHVDLGEMSWIIKDRYTSNFEVKHGYGGLYEQTYYLYK